MRIRNLTKKALLILIPVGLQYSTKNDEEQTLIQLKDSKLNLSSKESKDIIMDAYCTEGDDDCPAEDLAFSIKPAKDKDLLEFIDYLKTANIESDDTFQDAVWAITDGEDIAHIVAEAEEEEDLREYVSETTGRENRWYTAPKERTVDESGQINSESVVIEGKLKFEIDDKTEIFQELWSPDGELVYTSPGSVPPMTGEITMEFTLRVKGWEKGDYIVNVRTSENVIKEFPFKV